MSNAINKSSDSRSLLSFLIRKLNKHFDSVDVITGSLITKPRRSDSDRGNKR